MGGVVGYSLSRVVDYGPGKMVGYGLDSPPALYRANIQRQTTIHT